MARTRKTPTETEVIPLTNLVKHEEYNGFKLGDVVTIKGERGTRYTFNGVVENTESGSKWADLFGGNKGVGPQLRGRTASYRAVPPEKLKRTK